MRIPLYSKTARLRTDPRGNDCAIAQSSPRGTGYESATHHSPSVRQSELPLAHIARATDAVPRGEPRGRSAFRGSSREPKLADLPAPGHGAIDLRKPPFRVAVKLPPFLAQDLIDQLGTDHAETTRQGRPIPTTQSAIFRPDPSSDLRLFRGHWSTSRPYGLRYIRKAQFQEIVHAAQ